MKGAKGFAGLLPVVQGAGLGQRQVRIQIDPGADRLFALGDPVKTGLGQFLGAEFPRLDGPPGGGGAQRRKLAFGYGNVKALPYFVFIVYNCSPERSWNPAAVPPILCQAGPIGNFAGDPHAEAGREEKHPPKGP